MVYDAIICIAVTTSIQNRWGKSKANSRRKIPVINGVVMSTKEEKKRQQVAAGIIQMLTFHIGLKTKSKWGR